MKLIQTTCLTVAPPRFVRTEDCIRCFVHRSRWGVNVRHNPVERLLPGTQVSERPIRFEIAEHEVSMQIVVPTASGHGSKGKSSVFF